MSLLFSGECFSGSVYYWKSIYEFIYNQRNFESMLTYDQMSIVIYSIFINDLLRKYMKVIKCVLHVVRGSSSQMSASLKALIAHQDEIVVCCHQSSKLLLFFLSSVEACRSSRRSASPAWGEPWPTGERVCTLVCFAVLYMMISEPWTVLCSETKPFKNPTVLLMVKPFTFLAVILWPCFMQISCTWPPA